MAAKLMLVDDEPAFRYATRIYLEGKGFEVIEAEDGVTALRLIDTEPLPDLVILDIEMPRITGIDVLKRLQNDNKTSQLPVVMLTARGDAEAETLSWMEGCDWYQVKTKPVNYDDLVLAINRLLEVSGMQR